MSLGVKILAVYYIAVNVVLFAVMWMDKLRAKKEKWRVPESTLFVVALLGGGIGGFGAMAAFHHKNRKIVFYLIFGISTMLHAAILYFMIRNAAL
ncbi:MAG: DUF1294 domain-containing protein [Firmicutes bacterium]|nr:DUF1294 domain-containing protein [Bacillota bacterium]